VSFGSLPFSHKYGMRWKDLFETRSPSREITRWVDASGARSYMRIDAMVGRVRHWLPKEISGLDKIYPKTGLSFGYAGNKNWNMHGDEGICFVVNRDRLTNLICDIDGQAVFEFSDAYDAYRMGAGSAGLQQARDRAIKFSGDRPTEAFVVGNIRELSSVLSHVIVGTDVDQKTAEMVRQYADKHNVPVKT
jgi:hypothetical protein